MDNKQLGRRLRRVRMAAGFSQTDLATKIGFKTSVPVSKIEAGLRKVTAADLAAWCENCGVTADAVLNGEPLTVDISEAVS